MEIITYIPKSFTLGESLEWERDYTDYKTSDGWAVTAKFRASGSTGFDIAASGENSIWTFSALPAATASLTAGVFYCQVWATRTNEAKIIETAAVVASAPFGATSVNFDGRSQYQKILQAIDALVAGKATLDQQAYQIGNRRLDRIPIPDLLALRSQYAKLYNREKRAAALKKGAGFAAPVRVRFDIPD
jgi:hypothetical protein